MSRWKREFWKLVAFRVENIKTEHLTLISFTQKTFDTLFKNIQLKCGLFETCKNQFVENFHLIEFYPPASVCLFSGTR